MPLIALTNDPIPQIAGLVIQMQSPEGAVSVFISHEAIQDIAPPANEGMLSKFSTHRANFEAIACAKFDCGSVEPDGSIRITTSDLIQR